LVLLQVLQNAGISCGLSQITRTLPLVIPDPCLGTSFQKNLDSGDIIMRCCKHQGGVAIIISCINVCP
jgi:hypothetical protein